MDDLKIIFTYIVGMTAGVITWILDSILLYLLIDMKLGAPIIITVFSIILFGILYLFLIWKIIGLIIKANIDENENNSRIKA